MGWGTWRVLGAWTASMGTGAVACHSGTHKPEAGVPTSHAPPPYKLRQLFFMLPSRWR